MAKNSKSSFDSMMKECLKPHSLLHTAGGVGLGLIITALIPSLSSIVIGVGVVIVVVVLEMVTAKN